MPYIGGKLHAAKQEIPEYLRRVLADKACSHCVVVPVSKESSAIYVLLLRVRELEVQQVADILLVGSPGLGFFLETERLAKLGVNTILLTAGGSGLSTNLRCACDFALWRKYEGVLTIAGHKDDDLATISVLTNALVRGCDLVQASRFVSHQRKRSASLLRTCLGVYNPKISLLMD